MYCVVTSQVNSKDVNRFQMVSWIKFQTIWCFFVHMDHTKTASDIDNHLCFISHHNVIFFLLKAYANVLKANMDNLKKRDKRTEKSKAKKSKATQ